ncbi:MAG: hypothetical protein JST60_00450 [Chloroflexi bacterium SZAS-1]|jgi:hypothetical protein|nr:hypothetical protein [Chloroflexi bacterium SZAS-1]HNP86765.1 hypothetical protein [Kouleothrix sp.]
MTTDNGLIIINLGSSIVTYAILIGLAALGWRKGFRYMLSIAVFITIGYLLTVQGGNFVVGLLNRFYSNGPKLVAFALGRDPVTVDALPPLIPDNFQAPLLLRVLVFVALLAVGIAYAWPWEGSPLKPNDKAQNMRLLGLLAGLYIGVLGISAASSFWEAAPESLNQGGLISSALTGLPNYASVIPSMIGAFLILLIVIILLRFNRVWKA